MRKIVAAGVLSIYLISVVGAACAVLGCKCSIFDSSHTAHSCCCSHCSAEAENLSGVATFTDAPADNCCNHNHSTDTQLYTLDYTERQSHLRIVVVLPDAMLAVEPQEEFISQSTRHLLFQPPHDGLPAVAGSVMALRAPPVIA